MSKKAIQYRKATLRNCNASLTIAETEAYISISVSDSRDGASTVVHHPEKGGNPRVYAALQELLSAMEECPQSESQRTNQEAPAA